jgi:hypothetical protein
MKGVIFNLVEGVVRSEHGDGMWDEIVDDAGVTGAYTSLGSYPDEDLEAIASTVARRLQADPADVVVHVGRQSIASLASTYPQFFEPHADVRSFLLTLNDIIHPEVRKLYPGATPPHFEMRSDDGDQLDLVYRSDRRRCDLAEGLILGAADHYGEPISLSQPKCTRRGDDHCVLRVRIR